MRQTKEEILEVSALNKMISLASLRMISEHFLKIGNKTSRGGKGKCTEFQLEIFQVWSKRGRRKLWGVHYKGSAFYSVKGF